jgi:hypothetical protein
VKLFPDNNSIPTKKVNTEEPTTFFPNPSSRQSTLQYYLDKSSHVNISVYDMIGTKIVTLYESQVDAGYQNLSVDLSNFETGRYLINIAFEGRSITYPIIVLR